MMEAIMVPLFGFQHPLLSICVETNGRKTQLLHQNENKTDYTPTSKHQVYACGGCLSLCNVGKYN